MRGAGGAQATVRGAEEATVGGARGRIRATVRGEGGVEVELRREAFGSREIEQNTSCTLKGCIKNPLLCKMVLVVFGLAGRAT